MRTILFSFVLIAGLLNHSGQSQVLPGTVLTPKREVAITIDDLPMGGRRLKFASRSERYETDDRGLGNAKGSCHRLY